jgi:hypothetical protein
MRASARRRLAAISAISAQTTAIKRFRPAPGPKARGVKRADRKAKREDSKRKTEANVPFLLLTNSALRRDARVSFVLVREFSNVPRKPSPSDNSLSSPACDNSPPSPNDVLPERLRAELPSLPRVADRRALAPIITRLLFPVSYRTLETWPLRWRLVNGHAVTDVAEALALAYRRFAAAPVLIGGPPASRRRRPGAPAALHLNAARPPGSSRDRGARPQARAERRRLKPPLPHEDRKAAMPEAQAERKERADRAEQEPERVIKACRARPDSVRVEQAGITL